MSQVKRKLSRIDRFKQETKWERRIINNFKLGAERPVAKDIWKHVLKHLRRKEKPDTSQQALAALFEMPESAVSRGFNDGYVTFTNLVTMLMVLEWQFADVRRQLDEPFVLPARAI